MSKQGFLLDTNICVFLFRGKFGVRDRLNKVEHNNCFISEVTVAELKFGVECSSQRDKNLAILNDFLSEVNILPFESAIDLYAKEKARLKRAGTPVDDFDLLIGCTAKACDLTMVTDNVRHFQHIDGLQIENWIER